MYRAVKCACGHPICKDWHIDPVAWVQGVKFTEEQAKAVAAFLERFDKGQGRPFNDELAEKIIDAQVKTIDGLRAEFLKWKSRAEALAETLAVEIDPNPDIPPDTQLGV